MLVSYGLVLIFFAAEFLLGVACDSRQFEYDERIPLDPKSASQSSTVHGDDVDYVAGRALDQDEDLCSRTANVPPRWWMVDLPKITDITRIKILPSDDESGVTYMKVTVSNKLHRHEEPVQCMQIGSESNNEEYYWLDYNCSAGKFLAATGANVKIEDVRPSIGTNVLSLCEVEIYGLKDLHLQLNTSENTTTPNPETNLGSNTVVSYASVQESSSATALAPSLIVLVFMCSVVLQHLLKFGQPWSTVNTSNL